MSVIVTRTIQIICLILILVSFFGIIYAQGNEQLIDRAGSTLGFSLIIFLLATILRVVSDAGEKLLLAAGYRKEDKNRLGARQETNP